MDRQTNNSSQILDDNLDAPIDSFTPAEVEASREETKRLWLAELKDAHDVFGQLQIDPKYQEFDHFTQCQDPAQDERLQFFFDVDQTGEKLHRPTGQIDPWRSGETTSWTFTMRQFLWDKWLTYQATVVDVLSSAGRLTQEEGKEYVESQFKILLEVIKRDFKTEFSRYIDLIVPFMSPGVKEMDALEQEKRFITAGSGGMMLAWFGFVYGGSIVTTKENGSDGIRGFKKEAAQQATVFREIKLRNGANNLDLSEKEVWNQIKAALDAGSRTFSFTMASKTG